MAGLQRRLYWLDALRGLAIMGVVLVHTGQILHAESGFWKFATNWGQYGVQLFFVVSAITISISYSSHIASFGVGYGSALPWFIKRVFRIAPLYYIGITVYVLERLMMMRLTHGRYGAVPDIWDIIANTLFIHTWLPSANNSVVPGGWSIGVEMFFYALVPLIWLVDARRRVVFLITASAIGFILTSFVGHAEDNSFLYYWFPTQAAALCVGLVYFDRFVGARSVPNRPLALLVLVTFSAATLWCGTWGEIVPRLAVVTAAISFAALTECIRERASPLLANTFTVSLGKISYSVYIFHFLVLDGMRTAFKLFGVAPDLLLPVTPLVFAVVIAVTCVIAAVSKRYIEEPFIKLSHRIAATANRRASLAASEGS